MPRSSSWLLAVVAASAGACGSASAPGPAAREPGGGERALRSESIDQPAVRPLDRFASRLSALAIDEISIAPGDAEAPCRGVRPPFRVVSALGDGGEGVSCLFGDGDAAACVNFVDHETNRAEQALCSETGEAADVPSRVRQAAAAAAAGWRIAPIPAPEGHRALSLRTGDDYYLLVRRGSEWRASPMPVGRTDGHEVGPERLLDSRSIGEEPTVALVASSYRGGSQQGELTTRLFILSSDGLTEQAVKDIGLLVWTIDPDERTALPDGAQSLRGRPHLEVLLEPSITGDGAVRLDLIREHRPEPDRSRFEHEPCTPGGAGDVLGLACPVRRLDALEKEAGFWRLHDGALVKDRH